MLSARTGLEVALYRNGRRKKKRPIDCPRRRSPSWDKTAPRIKRFTPRRKKGGKDEKITVILSHVPTRTEKKENREAENEDTKREY